ncbi:MAG: haloacid dehalogenase-like hydrolase [Bdellovibrionaceae bacterium]|nr:haloacid dehalogenase-like hydrolase [Pseudobdellovibrionaceae bacterium]
MISNKNKLVNSFPPQLMDMLTRTLERASRECDGPRIAAFDADGTLWDTDAGESFFDYQIHHCGLPGLPADPWQHYHDLKKADPRVAYMWLAQINAGQALHEVRAWARACVEKARPFPIFESQKALIETLQHLRFEIYVVTASVKWAVEPAAALLGIDQDHVLGITTEVEDDLVTKTPVLPITWRQGKSEALLKATRGARPIFASGNTLGDIALLECASHLRLAVSTQDVPGTGLFEEERKLREEAQTRGWTMHAFRPL